MILSENLLLQADKYLVNKLTETELSAFLLELNSNTELANYVAINKEMSIQFSDTDWQFIEDSDSNNTKDLQTYFKSDEAIALKSALNDAAQKHKTISKPNKANNNKVFSFLAIAASIILLVGLFFLNRTGNIYDNYNSWTELPSMIERGEAKSAILENAEIKFVAKDFAGANKLYTTYLTETKSNNTNVLLYLGITQLELNQNKNALATFDKVIDSDSIDFSKGYWYKALVYLKVKYNSNAITQLKLITKDNSNYKYNEALKLLSQLE